MDKHAGSLPVCERDGCGNHVSKSRNRFCSHKCAQIASRAPITCKRAGCEEVVGDETSVFCSGACESAYAKQTRLWVPRAGKTTAFVDLSQLREDLLRDIKLLASNSSALKAKAVKPPKNASHLHLVAPVDLHIGKLAWAPETGENYDTHIAEGRLKQAVDVLISRAAVFPVERQLFVVGNDLLQVDSLWSTTTAGTFQDVDSRYRKMFRKAVSIMAWSIARLAEVAPVDVVVVPGNHDTLASFHIGEVLAAMFSEHGGVSINSSLMPRQYYRYGNTLMGFTHGNEENHADLPLIMATEQPEQWAKTRFHEWFLGHWHKKKETRYTSGDTHNGVSVRVLPSLTGTDAWHARKGFIGTLRRSESFLFNAEEGCVASFVATIDEGEKAA